MKITEAFICLDCDEILSYRHFGLGGTCPACGSLSLWSISRWIKSLGKERVWYVQSAQVVK